MSKSNIGHVVELYVGDVTLNVWVDRKLKADGGNFGGIEIGGWADDKKNCYWDNLDFFLTCTKKEFNKECKKELKEKGFPVRRTRKSIGRLLRRAIKLKILKPNENTTINSVCDNINSLDSRFRITNRQPSEGEK